MDLIVYLEKCAQCAQTDSDTKTKRMMAPTTRY